MKMHQTRTLALLFSLTCSAPVWAAKPPVAAEAPTIDLDALRTEAELALKELQASRDPAIRALVLEAELAKAPENTKNLLEAALSDNDILLQVLPMALLNSSTHAAAMEKLSLALCDDATAEKAWTIWRTLSNSDQSAALTKCPNNAQVKSELLARGGANAWKLLESAISDGTLTAEERTALDQFDDAVAEEWAFAHMEDRSAVGAEARALLTRLPSTKTSKAKIKSLEKIYNNSSDFETRLPIAAVLAHRSKIDGTSLNRDEITRTLHAGVSVRYQNQEGRKIAWYGLSALYNAELLQKLKPILLGNLPEDEVQVAYSGLILAGKREVSAPLLDILENAAKSDRRFQREHALRALGDLHREEARSIFQAAMSEGHVNSRYYAAKGLGDIAKPGDEATLQNLIRKEPDAQVKVALVNALGALATPATVPPLQMLLTSKDLDLKQATLEALVKTGRPEAFKSISLFKRDADSGLRARAWQILLETDGQDALNEFKTTALPFVDRATLVQILKSPKIPQSLLEVLAQDSNADKRALGLERLIASLPQSQAALQNLVKTSTYGETASGALKALSEHGLLSQEIVEEALQSSASELQSEAIKALYKLNDDSALSNIATLETTDPRVRAARALAIYELTNQAQKSKKGSKKGAKKSQKN